MKKILLFSLLTIIFLVGSAGNISAQNGEPPPFGGDDNPPPRKRPNLIQSLGLSRQQIQQLRQINRDLQPQLRQSQIRLREANQTLDEAIYGDEVDESRIRELVGNVQAAHSEMISNRTRMETSIRRILTPDQLVKFRELRQKFKPNNQNNKAVNQNQRLNNSPNETPAKRLRQLQKRRIN